MPLSGIIESKSKFLFVVERLLIDWPWGGKEANQRVMHFSKKEGR